MGAIKLEPYIFFKGNCREAMDFYKGVFGGEVTIQSYKDVGAKEEQLGEDAVMHAKLEGGAAALMASDTAMASQKAAKVSLSLTGEDEDKLRNIFDGLSQDVEVKYPLKKEFWGDTFGSVTDKYGVEWMVNISAKKDAAAE
jgi:PhnB protein